MTPEDFPRLFAAAFAGQDAPALSLMLAEDAEVVTLTGAVAESRIEAQAILEQEFAGTFARVRLVSGKTRLRPLGPGGAVVHQRYVVIGAVGPDGQELPRLAAILTAVLLARSDGWHAVSMTFSAQA